MQLLRSVLCKRQLLGVLADKLGCVQVEATKFTEVGFHGRDVDQIIRDLVDNAIILTKQNLRKKMQKQIAMAVEDKLIDALCGPQCEERAKVCQAVQNTAVSKCQPFSVYAKYYYPKP